MKVVYCNSNNFQKNNYYFALSTPSICSPTHLPSSHTGIANSSTSGIYFRPCAPVANLNPNAPFVGVWVANDLPEQSIASATLASALLLPPAAIQGHVMPSFPHTLIGLSPFANLNCQILFTRMGVSVIHPDGHCILKGWREQDGPCLVWRFPLQANKSNVLATVLFDYHKEPGPCYAAIFLQTPPFIPPPMGPRPTPDRTPPTSLPDQLHPSKGFHAVDGAGQACLVTYMYGAAQAMVSAAQSSKTPFDR